MTKKEKKYLEKKASIVRVIMNQSFEYETDEDYFSITPERYEANELAEKILSKFGLNKPKTLK